MMNAKMIPKQPVRTAAVATAKPKQQRTAKMAPSEMLPSDGLKSVWREVCRKQRPLMVAMILLALVSIVLLIVSMMMVRPQSTVVITGYGDVYGEIAGISGGYRRASWVSLLAFPILAVVYGLIHNLLALRVYRKYGRDAALILVIFTMLLIAGTFLIMFRVTGEW